MLEKIIFFLKKPLLNQSIYYTIFNLAGAAIPLICIPFLARALSPEEYGLYGLSFTMVQLLVQFVWLGFPSYIGQQFHKISKEDLALKVTQCLFYSNIAAAILLIIISLLSPYLYAKTSLSLPFWLVFTCIAIFQNVWMYLGTIWQFKGKVLTLGFWRISQAIFIYGAALIFILFFNAPWYCLLISLLISSACSALYALYWTKKNSYLIPFRHSKKDLISILKFSSPLLPFGISNILMMSTDRFVITAILGTSATGLYTISSQFAMGIFLVLSSIERAWTPWILEKLNTPYQQKTIFKVLTILSISSLVSALIYSLMITPIAQYLVPQEYYASLPLIPILSIGIALFSIFKFISPLLMNIHKTFYLGTISLLSAALNIILNIILIPLWGLYGAAWATFISYAILMLFTLITSIVLYRKRSFSLKKE